MLTWISLEPQETHEGVTCFVGPTSLISVRAEQLRVSCEEPVEIHFLRTKNGGACQLAPTRPKPWRDVSNARLREAQRGHTHTLLVRPHAPLDGGDAYLVSLTGPKTAQVEIALRTLESTLPRPTLPSSGDPELRGLFLWDAEGGRRTMWV